MWFRERGEIAHGEPSADLAPGQIVHAVDGAQVRFVVRARFDPTNRLPREPSRELLEGQYELRDA